MNMTHDPCTQQPFPLCLIAERMVSQERASRGLVRAYPGGRPLAVKRRVQTMNCVMPKLSGTGLNIEYIADPMSQWEDQYATTPMAAVQSIFPAPAAHELPTAFEQAISDRVMSVNRRLRHRSGPITAGGYAQPSTDQLIECDGTRISLYSRAATRRSEERRVGKECRSRWS